MTSPHRLTRQDALEAARVFLAENKILQVLTPDEVISTLVSKGKWIISDDAGAPATAAGAV